MKKEKILSTVAIFYFIFGFIFAAVFAIYYEWEFFSFLSPGFYSVILTWPYQMIGFLKDFLNYGFAGKPV